MTTCLARCCSFGLLCVSFVSVLCVCPSFPFGIVGRMLDVIVLIPDHCLSIYFPISNLKSNMFYLRWCFCCN